VVPVVRRLRELGHVVSVRGDGVAAEAFRSEGLTCLGWQAEEGQHQGDVAVALLREESPEVVLTGTSVGSTVERALVEAAARARIPTMGVLDSWNNYAARFAGPDGALQYLPDRLSVMDAGAREDLLHLGVPAETVIVTGHPHLDQTPLPTPESRRAARVEQSICADERLVVFASEPQVAFYGGSLGYSEIDILSQLLTLLGRMEDRWRVIVKPHPTEDPGALRLAIASAPVPATLVRDVPPRRLMLAADVVVGMTSIFLVEAALSGARVFSFHPRLNGCDEYFGSRLGVVHPVHSASELGAALATVRDDDHTRAESAGKACTLLRIDGLAADRVVEEILRLPTRGHG
jgi:hypothetical protein